jgi:hypothetical protein
MQPRKFRILSAITAGSLTLAAVAITATLSTAVPASASQAQNANAYVFWTNNAPPGADIINYDQFVAVDKKAPSTYWASLFDMAGATGGGYIGLQTDGNRANGSVGETALFSVWGADKSHNKDGKCTGFVENGTGLHCTAAFTIQTGITYRYRVQRISVDKTGAWWGGWIRNMSTGKDTYLGELHSQYLALTNPRNFSEYFADLPTPHPCNRIPQSRAEFFQPQLNLTGETKKVAGTYQYSTSVLNQPSIGSCVQAQIDPVTQGSLDGQMITLGTAPTSVEVAAGKPATPVTATSETFFSQKMSIDYGSGSVILNGAPAGDTPTPFTVDDKITVSVVRPDGTSASLSHDFSNGCAGTGLTSLPSLEFSQLLQQGINDVVVQLSDVCGDAEGNTDIWAVADNSLMVLIPGPDKA